MNEPAWKQLIFCPFCKNQFRATRVNSHINKHKIALTPEQQLELRVAVISFSRQNSERVRQDSAMLVEQKPRNATDALMSKSQGIFSTSTLSGGAFGQGKKR